jgi:hypothetical protein
MSKTIEQATTSEFILHKRLFRTRKISAVKELRDGVKARRDHNNPQFGWVTCPVGGPHCAGERYRQLHVSMTGVCQPCSSLSRRLSCSRPKHISGAIPLVERHPNNPKKFAFICANSRRNPDCLQKDYGWLSYFTKPEWRGLCKACLRFDGGHGKDRVDRTLKNGTRVLLSQEDDHGMVPVQYATCKHIRKESRDQILAHVGRLGKVCRACWENPIALAERIVELSQLDAPINSHLQASFNITTEEKQKRGRRAGVKYINPLTSRASLENAITKLWAHSQSTSEITFAVVASVFQSSGERIGADAVKKRFYELRTGMKWRDFVVFVVNEKGKLNQGN